MELSVRQAVILRDKGTCNWCGTDEDLQLHHLKHGKSTIDEIITLCRRCHVRIHYIEKVLLKGYREPFICKNHKHEEIEFLGYAFKNGTISICYCPGCGGGFKEDSEGEILDQWESNPFHELLMKTYARNEYDRSPSLKDFMAWYKWFKQLSREDQERLMQL